MSATWTGMQRKRLQGAEDAVPWWVNDKLRLHRYCQEEGLPMPAIYSTWRHPAEVDLSACPDQFVLKPSVMHSAWGVMVLERTGERSTFREMLSGRVLKEESIRREQQAVYERCQYKGSYRIFAEERISDDAAPNGVPFDYRVFCYFDRAMMIQQINRNSTPKEFAWFDENFEPLDPDGHIESDWSHISKGTHVRPAHWESMLEIAVSVTQRLRTPFMRVDMFNSTRGPLIGELTPAPGGPYYGDWYRFTPEYDAALGDAWIRAERALARAQEAE